MLGGIVVFGGKTTPRLRQFKKSEVLALFVIENCELICAPRSEVSKHGAGYAVPRRSEAVFTSHLQECLVGAVPGNDFRMVGFWVPDNDGPLETLRLESLR